MLNKKAVVIDIETNGLLADMVDFSSFPYKLKPSAKLWVVSFCDVQTGKVVSKCKEQITKEWLKKVIDHYDIIVAHNGVKFDFLALKLFGLLDYKISFSDETTFFGKKKEVADTLIWSRLFYPDRFGGHGLEAWGDRLKLNKKINYRQLCIDKGYIPADAPKGAEFQSFQEEMVGYCEMDVTVNRDVYLHLLKDKEGYAGWEQALKQEHKLADLAVRRESLGFWFDKDLAVKLVEDLTQKLTDLENKINPILPPRPLIQSELKHYSPPKIQLKKDGTPTSHLRNFTEKHNGVLLQKGEDWILGIGNKEIKIPFQEPIVTSLPATVKDLDHIKMFLIELGWKPTEWRMRDLTKDAKKQSLPFEKRVQALERWLGATFNGKYQKERLEELGMFDKEQILEELTERLKEDFPVMVPTSPSLRVGVEKELCSGLVKIEDKAPFAKDFALYLTYKHRRNSIAGGDIEDMDFDSETPNSGYLSQYREVDSRIPTPSIDIGTNTFRARHINIVNIPRIGSVYGEEMRELFGAGSDFLQLGWDMSSLEARIEAAYVYKYEGGPELAEMLVAEKPNDLHTVSGLKYGIPRSEAKSVNYAIIYSASPKKLAKMLGVPLKKAEEIYNEFWKINSALKDLKHKVEQFWENNGKKFIVSIDKRKVHTRSKHSLINALFQSAGSICMKYTVVLLMEKLENEGINTDPFMGKPDCCEMIMMHDEEQLAISRDLFRYKVFNTEQKAKDFVEGWEGNMLSPITKNSKGKYLIVLPNIVSEKIGEAIDEVNKLFNLPLPLGYEWMVGRNWKECH